MPFVPIVVALILLSCSTAALAQTAAVNGHLQAAAVRIPANTDIQLDGRLEETAWRDAPPLTELVQKEPTEGAVPSEQMDIRFVYDQNALYVGARMSSRAGAIQAPLSRRDQVDQAEYLLVSLDTYLDHRTAYCFGVTASGVRLDHYHSTDNEADSDMGFDPV